MLCPMALPICPSSLRNLSPSRASLNSHSPISRSIQPSVHGKDRRALFAARSLNVSPMEHPLLSNQVLSKESQAILSIQDFCQSMADPSRPSYGKLKGTPEVYTVR